MSFLSLLIALALEQWRPLVDRRALLAPMAGYAGLLEPGDVEEGLRAAAAVGDDLIQKRARGYVSPESFTHGSSEQRMRWFKRGLESGDIRTCDTFAAREL